MAHIKTVLRPIDIVFGDFIAKKGGSELVSIMASICSFAIHYGDSCVIIDRPFIKRYFGEENSISFHYSVEEIINELKSSTLVSDGSSVSYLVLRENRLYIWRYFTYEQNIVQTISQRMNTTSIPTFTDSLIPVVKELLKSDTDFSDFGGDLQLAGSLLPLFLNFSVISGGPGTGKTTTVAKLLSMLLLDTIETKIALVAPTGKAAQRMKESIIGSVRRFEEDSILPKEVISCLNTLEPMTLHRLLGVKYMTSKFRHNRDNKLEYDCIVVDEASMVSLPLLSSLFDALNSDTKVILLGDQYQLASVEAGAVLGDICSAFENNSFSRDFVAYHSRFCSPNNKVQESEKVTPIIQLNRSFRFSPNGGIGKISRLINSHDSSVIELLKNPDEEVILTESISDTELLSYSEKLRTSSSIEEALRNITSGIILTLQNSGETGQEEINSRLLQLLTKGTDQFVNYTPIMVLENRYDLSLYNGDTGILYKEDDTWKASFIIEGEIRSFPLLLLPKYQVAFAITVHKSQGSEYSRVATILPQRENPLVTTELIYTAITRCKPIQGEEKASVVIVGSEKVLQYAIENRVERFSGIKEEFVK